jgi:hypothetical protein
LHRIAVQIVCLNMILTEPVSTPDQVRGRHFRGMLERDELWLNQHPALAFCLSMIFSENR